MNLKKIKMLLCLLAAVIYLSSCTVFSTAENLLSPPALSSEQSAVYKALTKETGKNINLVFPSEGEIRSAYVFGDFDSDGTNEAAVFYSFSDGAESSVRINILDTNENGAWHSVYDLAGKGDGIGEVKIERIGNSGKNYICVEYGLIAVQNKILEVYSYNNNRLETVFSDYCVKYFITDFNCDGENEIAAAAEGSENETASVYMAVETEDGGIAEISRTALSGGFTSIRSITSGYVGENTPALFIDEGFPDGTVSTEIVYSISGALRNPSDAENSTIPEDTKRITGYYSMDCDSDGITEIPVTEVCTGYENRTEKLMLTKWCVLYNYEITEKYTGWYNKSEKYSLMFPARWEGLVTVRTDASTGASVFCRYDGAVETSTELLRIISVEKTDTEMYLNSGWHIIKEGDNADYLVKYSDSEDESLVLTSTEVMNNFYVYR